MDLIVVAVRDDDLPSTPWRPSLVHHVDGSPTDEVVQALVDGKTQYGEVNCAAVNLRVEDVEITAVTQFVPPPSPEAPPVDTPWTPLPEAETPVEETPTPEASPGPSSSPDGGTDTTGDSGVDTTGAGIDEGPVGTTGLPPVEGDTGGDTTTAAP